ncbi:hypothetical protein BDF22DRAFT_733650 [Syncephalis plumigaleata]|nr:hypothetical protein BDF22DRAFT_733650 [Syncephalis plumigaleata]
MLAAPWLYGIDVSITEYSNVNDIGCILFPFYSAARVAHDRAQKSDNTTTTVVRIANAVTAGEADDTLSEELEEECRRFDVVTRIHIEVDDDTAGAAYIFVQFADVSGAQQAVKMLHGRWFGGRQLAVDLYNQYAFIRCNYRLAM